MCSKEGPNGFNFSINGSEGGVKVGEGGRWGERVVKVWFAPKFASFETGM
jgi:hypothetical protein